MTDNLRNTRYLFQVVLPTALAVGAPLVVWLWYPTAGPVLLALLIGAYGAWAIGRRMSISPRDRGAPRLEEARRLASAGQRREAWRIYRVLSLGESELGDLYDLGHALERDGRREISRQIYERIAEIDPLFRDIGDQLSRPAPDREAPRSERASGVTLGRYRLLRRIGKGSTGRVYVGIDPKINRKIAIKTVDLAGEFELEAIGEIRERFLREAETAGRLNHPDIVTIFDVGEQDNVAYIAMELLRGRMLSEYTKPGKLLRLSTALDLCARAASALDYAHRNNVIHRDIKPANIMYDSVTGSMKLTDFGIARMTGVSRTRTGIVLGTPSFMSPEQLAGDELSGQADLYSLGVSLYQLLTGQLPFRGSSMTELMYAITNEPHRRVTSIRSELPNRIDEVIDGSLAKRPEDRFSSGASMAQALRKIAALAA